MLGQTTPRPPQPPEPRAASMEGRAIARPNSATAAGSSHSTSLQWRAEQLLGQTTHPPGTEWRTPGLQWRAEQLLGQTHLAASPHRHCRCSFNGGPSNCSAKRRPPGSRPPAPTSASMEGRAIARPNFVRRVRVNPEWSLQWRAEQLLGQTCWECSWRCWGFAGFNGGPSNCSAKPEAAEEANHEHHCRFNGGPSNCSAKRAFWRSWSVNRIVASMEGRAIARPNRVRRVRCAAARHASMEGRAIARPNGGGGVGAAAALLLQWRAEQLLGQTSPTPQGGQAVTAALQWRGRAIARPNSAGQVSSATVARRLQWRAEQLLGQTAGVRSPRSAVLGLQWRAEQLLGQTAPSVRRAPHAPLGFNGGPSNCSAKPLLASLLQHLLAASMEGRAIARPNQPSVSGASIPSKRLQWRAEQLLGQTPHRCNVLVAHSRFNGGPSNCSAKRRPHRHRRASEGRASMEGRAIARPNAFTERTP